MSKIVQNKEKGFKNYFDLPGELRSMVIEELPIDDRGRFSGCSMVCNIEVKASKDYVESLTFESYASDRVEITVSHSGSVPSGYTVEFSDLFGTKYMEWSSPFNNERHRLFLDPSTEVIEEACEHFKKLLKKYQRSIKKLVLCTLGSNEDLMLSNMGITRMNNLEELDVCGNFDYQQFLAKTRKPLKKLSINGNKNEELDLDRVYEVQDEVIMDNLKINKSQFAQLSAKNIYAHIGALTEQDVFEFIKSWQQGTIGRKVDEFRWNLEGSNFNVPQLFRLLGASDRVRRLQLDLPHFNIPDRMAKLNSYPNLLTVKFQN